MKPTEFKGKETMSYNKTEQPPAEGAEAFVKSKGLNLDYVKGIQLFLNPKYTVIDLMTEFAAQPQPTAEGAAEIPTAEEFVNKYYNLPQSKIMTVRVGSLIKCLERFATLHAQRIADKMVSERLREELIGYDKFLSNTYWGISHIIKRDEAVDEYLNGRNK